MAESRHIDGISEEFAPLAYRASAALKDAVDAINNNDDGDSIDRLTFALGQLLEALKATNTSLADLEAKVAGYDVVREV